MQNNLNNTVHKKMVFKCITGIAAIFVAVYWGYLLFQDIERIKLMLVWDTMGHVSVFDSVGFISILNWTLVRPIVIIMAMVMFIVYIFAFYEKKHFLVICSAIILAIWNTLTFFINTLVSSMDFILRMEFTLYSILFVFNAFTYFIIALNFIFIALKYGNKVKFSIKAIPIITIVISAASIILMTFSHGSFSMGLLRIIILDVSYIIPFMLFILFCPIASDGIKIIN